MASKFMAFENVASTSSASLDQDAAGERMEMSSSQHPNYQTNHHMPDGAESTNAYGGGEGGGVVPDQEEDDYIEEKTEKDVGYRKFFYNNSEQFKCISGGLLLLMGSGIHIVWGIFRMFFVSNCIEKSSFSLHLVIWSWYIGAIAGCCSAGFAVLKIRKGHIYAFGGGLLAFSGLLLIISDNHINIWSFMARAVGGYAQGLTYVIVIVHASENATKEFRELLMMIVGAVINYSMLVSVLSFFHTEGLFKTGYLNGVGLMAFGVITSMITIKHATETVPFILQNNGSELDALQTVAKLKKRPVAARSVNNDFLLLKNQVQDEIDQYGTPNFLKILSPENRKSLIFCCYGRLCSVLSFNLPLIVMIMLFLRNSVDKEAGIAGTLGECRGQCDYLVSYENDRLEDFWTCVAERHNKTIEIELGKRPANEEKSRPKRFAIESGETPFFDDEDVVPVMLKMWKNSMALKRDVNEEKKDDDKKGAPEKNDGDKTGEKKDGPDSPSDKDSNAKEKPKEQKEENGKEKPIEQKDENAKEKPIEQKDENAKEKPKEEKEEKPKDQKEENAKEKPKDQKEEKPKEQKEESAKEKPKEQKEENAKEKAKPKTESKPKPKEKEKPKNEANSKGKENPKDKNEKSKSPAEKNGKPEEKREEEKQKAMVAATGGFFGYLVAIIHSRELTLILLAWFVFGTLTTLTLYYFSMKRFIYRISLVLSSVLVFTGLFNAFGTLKTIFHICLIIYFNYVTIPIDIFGHCILAEAFPITLKAFSIAFVAIVEHLVHIVLITLYLAPWFHDSIIIFMCVVAFVSHEISRNLPEKGNLPLGEAHQQYQNVDLMLFNDPKSGYNQQQEFI